MAMPKPQYFINPKTRQVQILAGRDTQHRRNIESAIDDGFHEVTEREAGIFREDTQKLLSAGWDRKPGTLAKFLHVITGGAA